MQANRNVVAHNYGKIDKEILWETIMNAIPVLPLFMTGAESYRFWQNSWKEEVNKILLRLG